MIHIQGISLVKLTALCYIDTNHMTGPHGTSFTSTHINMAKTIEIIFFQVSTATNPSSILSMSKSFLYFFSMASLMSTRTNPETSPHCNLCTGICKLRPGAGHMLALAPLPSGNNCNLELDLYII